jgi:ribonuclease HII
MTQPDENHQFEFKDSIQCTSIRRRSLADRIGNNFAFSFSSIGNTYEQAISTNISHHTHVKIKKNAHEGHPEGEARRIGRHRAVRIVQSLHDPWCRPRPELLQKITT